MNRSERVPVMIVDDEILAIDHLRNLVDWERSGFTVAATSTLPAEALDLVDRLRPRILIADIRMPRMDGLSFCERALEIDPTIRIILLSAHRDFDCAKRAIALGVSDYLIKHEIDGKTLLTKLAEISRDQERTERTVALARRRLIQDLLTGRRITVAWDDTLFACGGKTVSILLFQEDGPYPVLPRGAQKGLDLELRKRPARAAHEVIESIPLDNGRCLVLLSSAYTSNAIEQENRLALTFAAVAEGAGRTLSAAFYRSTSAPKELPEILRKLELRLDEAFFLGGGKLLDGEAAELRRMEEAVPIVFRAEIDRKLGRLLDLRKNAGLAPPEWDAASSREWNTPEGVRAWLQKSEKEADKLTRERAGYTRTILDAVDWICAHLAEDLSADSIAAATRARLSGERLRHRFREETGTTLLEYVTRRRIESACYLLAEGNLMVYEVADRCGFKDSRYFSRVFRERMGENPHEYAQRSKRHTYAHTL